MSRPIEHNYKRISTAVRMSAELHERLKAAARERDERVDFTPSGKPVTHGGTGNAYSNYGCRCDECREANRQRNARRRAERYEESKTDEIPAEHGLVATYANWGCRCGECIAANTRKTAAYRARINR